MTRAICVSIGGLYPHLSDEGSRREAAGLHQITQAWWRIDPEAARDCEYLLGVAEERVVSAYQITNAVKDWPTMPAGHELEGLRAIPSTHLSEGNWRRACSWRVALCGPIRYVALELDEAEAFVGLQLEGCEARALAGPR